MPRSEKKGYQTEGHLVYDIYDVCEAFSLDWIWFGNIQIIGMASFLCRSKVFNVIAFVVVRFREF